MSLFQSHLVPFSVGNTPFFNVLCEMKIIHFKMSKMNIPEELERMEQEEEERRNAAAERRARQGHGTSFSFMWDGMVGLLIAMLDLHPTIYKPWNGRLELEQPQILGT